MRKRTNIIFCVVLAIMGITGIVLFIAGMRSLLYDTNEPELVISTPAPVPTPSPTPVPTPSPTPIPTPTPTPIPEAVRTLSAYLPQVAAEAETRADMLGRLVFPDTGINVAVFTDNFTDANAYLRQAICDAEDSASMYYDSSCRCNIICDHSTQNFMPLPEVQVGQKAYLLKADGLTELVCTKLINGHNNNHIGLTDENYAALDHPGDIICYTCLDNWQNIRIVVLDVAGEYDMPPTSQ